VLCCSNVAAAATTSTGSGIDAPADVARRGEQLGEVDEPLRIGTIEAVDGLSSSPTAKHTAIGPGEQANQQEVRRRESWNSSTRSTRQARWALARAVGSASRISMARTIARRSRVTAKRLSSSRYRGNIAANPSTSPS